MDKLKINIVDWSVSNSIQARKFLDFLTVDYELQFSNNPDFLIYGPFGSEFMKYPNAIRIFITYENVRPDFNLCDYAAGYDRMIFGDRYYRIRTDVEPPSLNPEINYARRKFCNFIYWNTDWSKEAKLRQEFCKKLAKYKHVDCPGRALNNMKTDKLLPRHGDWHESKITFIKDYKFTIAFENGCYPGYVTEKLLDPFKANSIPIYYGDPDILIDFNNKSFINCNDFDTFDDVIKFIEYLDNNDSAYYDMLNQAPMNESYIPPAKTLQEWIAGIIKTGKRHPRGIFNSFWENPRRNNLIALGACTKSFLQPIAKKFGTPYTASLRLESYVSNEQVKNAIDKFVEPAGNILSMLLNLPEVCTDWIDPSRSVNADSTSHHAELLCSAAAHKGKAHNIRFISDPELKTQCQRVMSHLWPYSLSGREKTRIGEAGDGGSVMLKTNSCGTALSLGHKGQGLWEYELAEKGWKILQFEKNLKTPLKSHARIQVYSQSPAATEKDNLHISIADILKMTQADTKLVARIDMEGEEWELLEAMAEARQFAVFEQFCVEFHGVTQKCTLNRFEALLVKISKTHFIVHLHYHNYGPIIGFRDFLFSDLMEITFARRDLGEFKPSYESYPTPLDAPNVASLPEVFIGKFPDITGFDNPDAALASFTSNSINKLTEKAFYPYHTKFPNFDHYDCKVIFDETVKRRGSAQGVKLEDQTAQALHPRELKTAVELPARFDVYCNPFNFQFFFVHKPKAEKLYIVFSGSRTLNMQPPVFKRHSWNDGFDGSVLYVGDPLFSLYPALELGWYLGTSEIDIYPLMTILLQVVWQKYGFKHVLTYGSSGGGFAALKIAEYLPCSAIAINPQIYLQNYPYFQNFCKITGFKNKGININRAMITPSPLASYFIIQNDTDTHHLRSHLYPLMKSQGLLPKYGLTGARNIHVWQYHAYGGHNAQEDINLLRQILYIKENLPPPPHTHTHYTQWYKR